MDIYIQKHRVSLKRENHICGEERVNKERALELLSLSRGYLWDNVKQHQKATANFDIEGKNNYFYLKESHLNCISDELKRAVDWISFCKKSNAD